MWIPKLLAVVQLLVAVMAEFASIVDIGPYRHTLITQHNHYRKKIEATKMKEMVSKEKKKKIRKITLQLSNSHFCYCTEQFNLWFVC